MNVTKYDIKDMTKRRKERLTITLDKGLLILLDQFIDGKKIRNRSHAIEYVLNKELKPRVRQAVILAAGEGTRMRPYTYEMPKSMLTVKNKPLLEYMVEKLRDYNIRDIVIVVGKFGEKIEKYFGDGEKWGVKIRYIKEKSPTGTAYPLKEAEKYLKGKDPFLVAYSDILAEINLDDLIDYHEKNRGLATVALTTTHKLEKAGIAQLRGTKIVKFAEKPKGKLAKSGLINAGLIVLEKKVLERVPKKKGTSLEKDILEKLAKEEKVIGYPFEGRWYDVGTTEAYEKVLKKW